MIVQITFLALSMLLTLLFFLYGFNHYVFRASKPRPEDLKLEPPISNKISKGSN